MTYILWHVNNYTDVNWLWYTHRGISFACALTKLFVLLTTPDLILQEHLSGSCPPACTLKCTMPFTYTEKVNTPNRRVIQYYKNTLHYVIRSRSIRFLNALCAFYNARRRLSRVALWHLKLPRGICREELELLVAAVQLTLTGLRIVALSKADHHTEKRAVHVETSKLLLDYNRHIPKRLIGHLRRLCCFMVDRPAHTYEV